MKSCLLAIAAMALALWLLYQAWLRWALSAAKHPSLAGHARWSRRLARLLPFYEYPDARFFCADEAPEVVASMRRTAFKQLSELFATRFARSAGLTGDVAKSVSDMQFTARYRVPFQFSRRVREHLAGGSFLKASRGTRLIDLDGNQFYDLAGSYGVNVFGYDFYKECIERGAELVRDLGPVLGPYHPVMAYNVRRLQEISGLDEVSFHMSGTEAVMQAVRLARYHTGRRHLVRFCGAYHGWWGDVQPGVGNPAIAHDTYTLKDMSEQTLKVLRMRKDIACVLVNPLQALHPNANAPNDGALVDSGRRAGFDREAYSAWLRQLREVCIARGIVLIFDEVFVGFRLAPGGAQEYFGVRADMVTYGKTLGGGLPVGVVCGTHRLMRRYRDDHPADVCLARGTFNSHPYVMGAMHAFLEGLASEPVQRLYRNLDALWNGRAAALNARLAAEALPVRVSNLSSIWTVGYTRASEYNWMFQYYLRAHGLALSWVGTGRFIFSHNYTDEDFAAVMERILGAARDMDRDGWWWSDPNLTDRAIRRRLLREVLQAWWSGSSSAAPSVTSAIGSMSSPRSNASGAR
ncbi:MAG TPA: aminotransferase class III-fold pyridoxal phosphate-dependent enzyme [Steroidobacteraceae bacterium]